MADIVNDFLNTINKMARRNIDSTPIDLTVEAEIRMAYNVEVGEYKVAYMGNTFSAFSLDPTVVYQKGENVYVHVPQGDFSTKKIILGRSKYQNNSSYSERQDMINQYIPVGPNWLTDWYKLDHTPLQITAVAAAEKDNLVHLLGSSNTANWEDIGFQRVAPQPIDRDNKTRYPSSFMTDTQLRWGDAQLQQYARTLDFVMISADFRTEFNQDTHDIGEYSLLVECIAENPLYVPPNHPQYNPDELPHRIVEFHLGFNNFIGNPYVYIQQTPNKAAFSITPGQLQGLNKVSLMQDGFFVTDLIMDFDSEGLPYWTNPNYITNNIFVENIDIRFARKINLTDNLYYCYIETPLGNNVYSAKPTATPPIPTGKGQVELIAHLKYGFQEILQRETCEVRWYRESYDVTISDSRYDKLAGAGWCPVEKLWDYNGGAGPYTIDFDRLFVRIEAVDWKWRYKVVVIYQEKIQAFAEEDVWRSDSKYNLSLEQFTSPDNTKTLLRVKDLNDLDWQNNPNPEWRGTWYLLLQDGSYRQISDSRHQGPIEINDYLIHDIATFRVICYDPDDWQTQERGQLELTIISSTENDLWVEWIGNDTFTYDANGVVKWEAHKTEQTLYAKFTWMEGRASDYRIEVLAPDGVVLGGRSFYDSTASGGGYQIEDSMMDWMWIDIDNVIHFHIKEKYDLYKKINTYTLRIYTYRTGEVYELKKTINFLKDGDQGTQGSEWTAPIWPTNHDIADLNVRFTETLEYPAPLVRQGSFWDYRYNKLFLRPFVRKNGTLVEEMDPHEGYYYKVYWDVRLPNSASRDNLKNSSWLRLCYADSTSETAAITNDFFNQANLPGHLFPNVAKKNPATGAYSNGLMAYTEYYGNHLDNRGVVRVVGVNNPGTDNYGGGPAPTMEDGHYNFIVWAQIDIYQGTYMPDVSGLNDNGIYQGRVVENSGKLVASINSCYPVDIVLDQNSELLLSGDEKFNPKLINTNWPQYVDYNATGYDPTVFQHNLFFRYGENSERILDPIYNFPAWNITTQIQTIRSEIINHFQPNEDTVQKYQPKPYFFWEQGYNGAMRTYRTGEVWKTPTENAAPLGSAYYIRNQVFRLNAYGNVDINAWDGQGIDINEDNGTIFAPTVGAGYKDPFSNRFTGVIMGIDKSQRKSGRLETNGVIDYGIGNRQGLSGTDNEDKRQYMVGIYGYQEGVSSFGIMENGTAFFGRADRGGRIIIDGYNATIYGGANGMLEDPSIGDPMWNNMRLTLVDLTHRTGNVTWEDAQIPGGDTGINTTGTEVDGVRQGFNGQYFGSPGQMWPNTFPWWYQYVWQNAYILDKGYTPWWLQSGIRYDATPWTVSLIGNRPINYWDIPTVIPTYGEQLTGFGPNRASTTPAIEIGQHQRGLKPGLVPWGSLDRVFTDLYVPGERNFMVTYDGTLWAMNGVFMGNVISSNIIGGRIQGGEIGIGSDPGKQFAIFHGWELTGKDDWIRFSPPQLREYWGDWTSIHFANGRGVPPHAFFVDVDGNVTAKSIRIYGGSLHLNTFHILGQEDQDNNLGSYGDLLQFGESDFVGPVHIYGNIGIGPNLGPRTGPWASSASNRGNLWQFSGYVGMGIGKKFNTDPGPAGEVNLFTETMNWNGGDWFSAAAAGTTPTNLENIAFFSMDTAGEMVDLKNVKNFRGAFWPMAHYFEPGEIQDETTTKRSWFTTMSSFLNTTNRSFWGLSRAEGDNYFRVSPFSSEAALLAIRRQPLQENIQPNTLEGDANILGFLGRFNRNDPAVNAWDALGLTSLGEIPIILTSGSQIRASAKNAVILTGDDWTVQGSSNAYAKGKVADIRSFFQVGHPNNGGMGSIVGEVGRFGNIRITVKSNANSLAEAAYQTMIMWDMDKLMLSNNQNGLGTVELRPTEIIFTGKYAEPENQKNIYARFA